MTKHAQLVATIASPSGLASADAPRVLHWPGRRLLTQRSDAELITLDLQTPLANPLPEVRFPAPWPRRFGTAAVSPNQDVAVFAGLHAVHLVQATGATRWKLHHNCWCASCSQSHLSADEYLHDDSHSHSESGSSAFSSDGSLVWAHILGPLGSTSETDEGQELWIAADAKNGTITGRAETMTVASNSQHTSHPDPTQMGISIGEGEEGSPILWGQISDHSLTIRPIGMERILLDISPTGQQLLTTPVGQWSLAIHSTINSSISQNLDALGAVPHHPMNNRGKGRVYWDYEAAFIDENTIIAGTSESDAPYGEPRHWMVETQELSVVDQITYPITVSGPARSAGDGIWYTVSNDGEAVHLWRLSQA